MKYFKSFTIVLAGAIFLLSCQEPSFPNAELFHYPPVCRKYYLSMLLLMLQV